MNNELLLLSGADIPFPQAKVAIHQPTLKEISLVGEEYFNIGCRCLNFDVDSVADEDKVGLEGKTNFEIIMSIILDRRYARYRLGVNYLFTLLFPEYFFSFTPTEIKLKKEEQEFSINSSNYDAFIDIVNSMFLLDSNEGGGSEKYNPADKMAEKIAAKLKKRHQREAEQRQDEPTKIAIYSRYASILAVGEQKSLIDLMNYTPFQLMDEMTRFQKKQSWDSYVQARLAGAENLEEVDNWMIDIHP